MAASGRSRGPDLGVEDMQQNRRCQTSEEIRFTSGRSRAENTGSNVSDSQRGSLQSRDCYSNDLQLDGVENLHGPIGQAEARRQVHDFIDAESQCRAEAGESRVVGTFCKKRGSSITPQRGSSTVGNTAVGQAQRSGDIVDISPSTGSGLVPRATGRDKITVNPENTKGHDKKTKSAVYILKRQLQGRFPLHIGKITLDSDNIIGEPNPEPIYVHNSTDIANIATKKIEDTNNQSMSRGQLTRPPSVRAYKNQGIIAPITTTRLSYSILNNMNDDGSLDFLHLLQNVNAFHAHMLRAPKGNRPVSRFMRHHLPDLLRMGVVEKTEGPIVVHRTFTVPKKDSTLRLICDCRKLNRVFECPPAMHLPSIHNVIENLLDSEWMAHADARSYFYQFSLAPEIRSYFGAVLGHARGETCSIQFSSMPMGWSWAPAIAQRVSNRIVRDIGLAWVDNFLLFGKSKSEVENHAKEFRARVHAVQLEVDDLTMKPLQQACVLGIEFDLKNKKYRMSEKWTEKAYSRYNDIIGNGTWTAVELYTLSGLLMWRATVMKIPLCTFAHLLQTLGKVARKVHDEKSWEISFSPTDHLLGELTDAFSALKRNVWLKKIGHIPKEEKVEVWTDASSIAWAILLFNQGILETAKQGMTKPGAHIFYSELSAALGGIMAAVRKGHRDILLNVDNAPVAMALQRRASTNFTANRWMQYIPSNTNLEVKWVPTNAQIADPFTRKSSAEDLTPLPSIGTYIESLRRP